MEISKVTYIIVEYNPQILQAVTKKITTLALSIISSIKELSSLSLLSPFCSISWNGSSYGTDGTYAIAQNGIAITMSCSQTQITLVCILALAILFTVNSAQEKLQPK